MKAPEYVVVDSGYLDDDTVMGILNDLFSPEKIDGNEYAEVYLRL